MNGPRTVGHRWVVKIGSSLLTNNGLGLDSAAIAQWVQQLLVLHRAGLELILVSSGAKKNYKKAKIKEKITKKTRT